MAIPFVQSIDMNSLQILNFVVHSATTAPASPASGMMWWKSDTSLLQVYETATWMRLVKGPTSSTDNYVPQWDGTSGDKIKAGFSVVTSIGTPGVDTALATEKAIRDAIAGAIASEMTYKGAYDANTNTPDLDVSPSGVSIGDMYTVTAAGNFFTIAVQAGDVLIANQNNPTLATHWTIVNRNIQENFLELTDTPANYTGAGSRILRVNSGANAIEFVALSSIMSNLSQTSGGLATFSYNGTSAVTVGLNFTNLTNETILADTDEFAYYDASATAMRALTYSALKTALNSDLSFSSDTFRTWTFPADSGYTWGTANVVASGADTIDIIAGSGVAIDSDSTLKAIRIRVTGTGGLANAYSTMTDGTTNATASGGDTFKFRSANAYITLAVQNDDATHGDNLNITLASTVVATDKANTYENFNQIFRSSGLIIRNPANTQSYTFVGAAITAGRNITLPLLTGNDTMVTAAFTQTLTNKTINATNNTITDTSQALGDLLKNNGSKFVRFGRGTTGQILRSTGTDIEWVDLASSGLARASVGTPTGTTTTTLTYTHNLNSQSVAVTLIRISDNTVVQCEIETNTVNQVSLKFGTATSGNLYRIIVIG